MFAIVTIAGQQFKVEKDQEIFVHQLAANEGDNVSFSDVLLLNNNGAVTVGAPTVSKGDKVIIFKKKRRKGYRKKNGHRQSFTKIKIDSVG